MSKQTYSIDFFRKCGRKGGKKGGTSKSPAKVEASRETIAIARDVLQRRHAAAQRRQG